MKAIWIHSGKEIDVEQLKIEDVQRVGSKHTEHLKYPIRISGAKKQSDLDGKFFIETGTLNWLLFTELKFKVRNQITMNKTYTKESLKADFELETKIGASTEKNYYMYQYAFWLEEKLLSLSEPKASNVAKPVSAEEMKYLCTTFANKFRPSDLSEKDINEMYLEFIKEFALPSHSHLLSPQTKGEVTEVAIPTDKCIEEWWSQDKYRDENWWRDAPYRTNGDVVEEIKTAINYFFKTWQRIPNQNTSSPLSEITEEIKYGDYVRMDDRFETVHIWSKELEETNAGRWKPFKITEEKYNQEMKSLGITNPPRINT